MKPRTVDAARGRWVSILSALGVDEQYLRNRHGPCPFCGGEDRYRFDDKDGNGTFICNACGYGRGIEFVMRLKMCDFKTACEMVDPLISLAKMETVRKKDDPRPRLRKMWTDSTPIADGDAVMSYLSSRGIALPLSSDVRRHPKLGYWEDGQKKGEFQAMVCMLRAKNGDAVSLHTTYLDGGRKANVSTQKKMMPPIGKMTGSAVRLCPHEGTLAIAEGIETALAYTALRGIPCWAATNSTLLAQFEPPDDATRIVVAGDNDANYAGQHAAYSLANRLVIGGRSVTVDIPTTLGADWADVLAGGGDAN